MKATAVMASVLVTCSLVLSGCQTPTADQHDRTPTRIKAKSGGLNNVQPGPNKGRWK